jgi:hypothetical protein
MFSAPFLVTLLDRVKAVVRRVVRPVVVAPSHGAADRPLSPVSLGLVQGWMSAKLQALSALMRRIEAGETIEAPVRTARAVAVPGEPGRVTQGPGAPDERLPRGFGWMCRLSPGVRRDGIAFVALLNEPWMMAKVLAAPERMAGLIGPILTATGQRRPEWFPLAPRRVRAKRSAPACGEESWSPVMSADLGDVSSSGHVSGSEDVSLGGVASPAWPASRPEPDSGGRFLAPLDADFGATADRFILVAISHSFACHEGGISKMRQSRRPPSLVLIVTI